MPVEVADSLDWVGLTLDCDLVALHDFVDDLADIAQPDIDASSLNACVGGLLD